MIHGWGMNSEVWQFIRLVLEEKFKVIWIDLPGHGINQQVIAHSCDEIVEYISPHIPSPAHLVGWSLGGLITQAIAEKHPDKIKSMTLVASTPRFSKAKDWPHAMSREILDTFAENLMADTEGTLKRFIALQFMGVKGVKKIQRELIESVLMHQKSIKKGGGGVYEPIYRGIKPWVKNTQRVRL